MKHLLAITITLLPSAVLAQQFTPQQMLDVMTKSPSNRDVRVQDGVRSQIGSYYGAYDGAPAFYWERPDNPNVVAPYPGFVNYSSCRYECLASPQEHLKSKPDVIANRIGII